MDNIYWWTISSVDCFPEKDGETNVVCKIYWILSAKNEDYTVWKNGFTDIPNQSTLTFIPYKDLTQEEMINWVIENLGENTIKEYYAELDVELQEKLNPTIISPVLPWVS